MPQTHSNGKKIYSVDMMLAYINIFKPDYILIKVDDLKHHLEYSGWGEPGGAKYSPRAVLANKTKYIEEYSRIENVNLKYPIISTIGANGDVIDGIHRLTKSVLLNKKYIKSYVFNKSLMKKFLIDKNGNREKIRNLQTHDYITLFYKRFCL